MTDQDRAGQANVMPTAENQIAEALQELLEVDEIVRLLRARLNGVFWKLKSIQTSPCEGRKPNA